MYMYGYIYTYIYIYMHSIFQPQKITGVLCPGLGLNGGVGMKAVKAGRDQGPRKKGWILNINKWNYLFIYIDQHIYRSTYIYIIYV